MSWKSRTPGLQTSDGLYTLFAKPTSPLSCELAYKQICVLIQIHSEIVTSLRFNALVLKFRLNRNMSVFGLIMTESNMKT